MCFLPRVTLPIFSMMKPKIFFNDLSEIGVPVFTNVTIRSEFIELHRRVMIPEGLGDLATSGNLIVANLKNELKVVQTQLSKSRIDGKPLKFAARKIAEWREQLSAHQIDGRDGWELFCRDYLQGKIEPIWTDTCSALNVSFVSTRSGESQGWLTSDLSWEQMVGYVGQFGLGSSDAMILNLFMSSSFGGLVTADRDLIYAFTKLAPNDRFIIIPDSLV